MSRTRASGSGMPLPVVAYVQVLAAIAAVPLVVCLVSAVRSPSPTWWKVAVALGSFAAVSLGELDIRFGSQRFLMVWSESALAIGLLLLSPAWAVLAVSAGSALAAVMQRRTRIKTLFNVSLDTAAAALAVLVVSQWVGPVDVSSLGDLGVVVLAAALFGLVTYLATTVVVALSQERPLLSVFRRSLAPSLLSNVSNLAVTWFVLAIALVDQRVLLLLPVLLLSLRQVYMGRVRAREERESWQGLLEATRALADLDERVVLARAAGEATRLFGADGTEIELAGGRLVRSDEHGVDYDGPVAEAPEGEAGAVLERPIGPEAAPLGVLRLCFSGTVTLNDREQAMLGAVAAELHSALVNAGQHATARHEATHDPLTGLLNRAGLTDRGRDPLAGAVTAEVDAAVVLIHISGFREIVDTLGHAAGDAVLLHTARRLEAAVLPGELVARLEGDEFAVLLPKLTDPAQASHRADTLLGAVASPALIGGAGLTLTGVAGIAYSPRAEIALDELLRQAGVALHALHSSVGRIDFYAPERDVRSVSRLVLASELRAALQDMSQLDLVYQPIVDLTTGEAIAAEALVGWHHPARGPLAPEEFMPVVEHAGLLPDLTRRVLDIALGSAADWTRHGIGVPVAINVSPRTLLDRDFPGEVAAALSRHRVPPGRLSLEITETSVVSHLGVVDRVLDELRDLGVRLALDDFGTGWSSLSHLARLPVHEVKIAATFTERLLSSPQAAAVVRGTLEIARALDLRVVAEGMTGAIQRATLVSLGCHAGQGDHFFPPLPADRIGPALWSTSVRALAAPDGADVIPLSQRRPNRD
jgi:diguanylate cyclase (GGDEF)-like protein